MVFYSFLVSRQNSLIEQLTEKCGKLTEILTSSNLPQLTKNHIFPDNLAKNELEKDAEDDSLGL